MVTQKTSFTCPDCGGAIQKVEDGALTQYLCRIGHAYSIESALIAHSAREENILWNGVVLLEEGAELAEEVAQNRVSPEQAAELHRQATAKRALAARVREVVLQIPRVSTSDNSNGNF